MFNVRVRLAVAQIRIGWYRQRKTEGYPISIWRAMFGEYPRFSSYEMNEPGCPDWAIHDYMIVSSVDS